MWRPTAMTCIALVLVACGGYEDPTFDQVYDPATAEGPPERDTVPYSETRNLLWGDFHVHTGLSYDAFTMGTRALPDDAKLLGVPAPEPSSIQERAVTSAIWVRPVRRAAVTR